VKILSFSYCFPNHAQPTWGIFVQQRLAALARRMELQVVSPVPVFGFLGRWRPNPGPVCEQWQELTVYRPRFFYIPGIFKSWDARFYARGLRSWLEKLCQKFSPDLLDAHFVWPDGVGVALLAGQLGLPYTITLRGKIYPCLEVPSQRRQCAEALQHAAAVISVSEPMAEVAQRLGVPRDRLHVIPNGVDTEMFRPMDNKQQLREQLALGREGRLLVTVAHLGPRKGHREVITALSRLSEDVRLVIVGGDIEGGKNVRALRRLINSLKLRDRVILAGPQPYEKIPLYLNAADASVLASYREGCPNMVLESLACGRPVVATNVGAVPQVLTVPDHGRIVPVRDVNALTEALNQVLQSSWSAISIVQASSVKSWDVVAEEIGGIFADSISRNRT